MSNKYKTTRQSNITKLHCCKYKIQIIKMENLVLINLTIIYDMHKFNL